MSFRYKNSTDYFASIGKSKEDFIADLKKDSDSLTNAMEEYARIWYEQQKYKHYWLLDFYDLKSKYGIKMAFESLENCFLTTINQLIGIDLYQGTRCTIDGNKITVYIVKKDSPKDAVPLIGSEVMLLSTISDDILGIRTNEIQFESSHIFSPIDLGRKWQTIHASYFLLKWDLVSKIVNEFCDLHIMLEQKIAVAKNKKETKKK